MFLAEDVADHFQRVALKKVRNPVYMEDEVQTRVGQKLDGNLVLEVLRVHVPKEEQEVFGQRHWATAASHPEMLSDECTATGQYVVVLPWAQASLSQVSAILYSSIQFSPLCKFTAKESLL